MIDPSPAPSSILVDLELPEPEPLPAELVRVLSSLRVVLLGWFSVPEQTTPAQARDQFGAVAEDTLDAAARRFEEAGAEVTTRLVFTGDELDTISRVSVEESCDAVLIPGPVEQLRRVLVPLRGIQNVREIAPFVADLCQDGTARVTLLHILEGDETTAASREDVLEPAAERMRSAGIKADLLELNSVAADSPADTIVEWAGEHDLAVLGEIKASVREILFGTVPEQIVEQTNTPVIVVRREDEDVTAAEQATQAGSS
ncbi:universal stress protein [Salinibacter ruber]|uniref:Nucleotide-binding universal stress UspA family protein n=1 Tax=Salinibacter ruber TaxID=146919 RepID=A0A9X2U8K7_9BACT|nr:universal stress protein [Salinibacter ruber]MCS3951672.1 nucleotide-binding universal stress UspA family protein [Salinibacter ruber]MCS4118316.1 nucleotide-binding universal stress UspA family protein [Salinibacter ruber]MCS4154320.1 nucleotide-binding universal stress UspA family protein [Salinibacter ruber]MCS4187376.1 nucleotide-binding universal stress UspA family protein [Salinibacter ruber]